MNLSAKYNKIAIISAVFLFVLIMIPQVTKASYYRDPFVKIYTYNGTYQETSNFFAYQPEFKGGVSLAAGNLDSDVRPEIVTAAGVGGGPQVRLFDADGTPIRDFWAYASNMNKGVNVAVGDLDGDGKNEIVTAPKYGGGPHIRTFDRYGNAKFSMGFFAYDYNFKGGVNITTCDIDGNGKDEIITGAGAGGSAQVRVFNYKGELVVSDFWPFSESDRGGVSVACANIDGGAEEEIVMSIQSKGENWIKIYKADEYKTIVGYFRGWPEDVRTGTNITGGDMDGDGTDEIVAAVYANGGPQVKIFEADGFEIQPSFLGFEEDFRGGLNITTANMDNNNSDEIILAPSKPRAEGRTDLGKYVLVDLSEQKLYAYDEGFLENSFLISSGLVGPTPQGHFNVQRKIYSHLYSGPDYYLPNTLYNMQFTPHYYLHGAYWHNNFGHPMSHGCVNIHYRDAAWLYDWISVGDDVLIQY